MVDGFYGALRTGAPFVLSLLRIVAALVLLEHGTQKMFDFPPMPRFGGFPGAAGPAQAGGPAAPQAQRVAPAGAADGAAAATATATTPSAPGIVSTVATPTTPAPAANATAAAPPAGSPGPRAGGPPGAGRAPGGGGGPPSYFALFPLASWIETVAGALLVVGLFSRSAAFLLSGETAVVYFIAHLPMGLYPISNGGEVAVLFSWTFLYIVFAGPGPISVDGLWKRMRGSVAPRAVEQTVPG